MSNAPKVIKSAKNIKFLDNGTILVENVICSYPHLFSPWSKEEGKPKKYSVKGIMSNKTHADAIKALRDHVKELQKEWFKGPVGAANIFVKNGDDAGKPETEDAWLVNASENADKRPNVINRDKSRINAEDDIIYPGCVINILIKPWKQQNVHGKKVNANLLAVQFVADGTRFGEERMDTSEAFGEIEGEFGAGDAGDDSWDET